MRFHGLAFFFACFASLLGGDVSTWKAGVASTVITPEETIWMAGYASRLEPARGTLQELYAKALILEDPRGEQVVWVTSDLLGFPASFTAEIKKELSVLPGLSEDRIALNASHTHAGPALQGTLDVAYRMNSREQQKVASYTSRLQKKMVALVREAARQMEPVRISYGETRVDFAVNRRVPTSEGFVIGANREGPVDHSVPFLAVDTEGGDLKAVVFGYSCHCTTLQGENLFYHGDYAGVAQSRLEELHAGATALFLTGTAGDINPSPRGTLELARRHGSALAEAVTGALNGPLRRVNGFLQTRYARVPLPFSKVPSRKELQERSADPSTSVFVRRHADSLLRVLDEGKDIDRPYPYPVQLWQLGNHLTWIGLAGEVVLDYALYLRRELSNETLWISGYTNDVFAYIPSRRILREGGYEAVDSMIYYGQPSSFDPSVEDRILGKILELFEDLEPSRGDSHDGT